MGSRDDAVGVFIDMSLTLRSWNFSTSVGGSLALFLPPECKSSCKAIEAALQTSDQSLKR